MKKEVKGFEVGQKVRRRLPLKDGKPLQRFPPEPLNGEILGFKAMGPKGTHSVFGPNEWVVVKWEDGEVDDNEPHTIEPA